MARNSKFISFSNFFVSKISAQIKPLKKACSMRLLNAITFSGEIQQKVWSKISIFDG
jgi:hypothetical protein